MQTGKIIRFKSLVAMCAYIQEKGYEVVGWRGDLVVARLTPATPPPTPPHLEERQMERGVVERSASQ